MHEHFPACDLTFENVLLVDSMRFEHVSLDARCGGVDDEDSPGQVARALPAVQQLEEPRPCSERGEIYDEAM